MSDMRTEGDELAELERLDAEWAAAAAAGEDVDRILSFWSEDAIVLPPGAPPLIGKDAIRNYVTTSLGIPGFSIRWETEQFTISQAREFAYGVGTNRLTFNDESGDLVTSDGKVVTIWRKENGGGWKCVVDIWNDVAAPD